MITTKTLKAMGVGELRSHPHFWTSPWRGRSAVIGQDICHSLEVWLKISFIQTAVGKEHR